MSSYVLELSCGGRDDAVAAATTVKLYVVVSDSLCVRKENALAESVAAKAV
jgi:hypothetical protein